MLSGHLVSRNTWHNHMFKLETTKKDIISHLRVRLIHFHKEEFLLCKIGSDKSIKTVNKRWISSKLYLIRKKFGIKKQLKFLKNTS